MSSLSVKNSFGANTLSEVFIGFAQEELDKALVSKGIAKVDSRNQNLFHNPYRTTPVGFDGSASNTYSTETFTATDDTLQPTRRAGASEHIDNIEQALSGDDLTASRARRMGVTMAQKVDRFMLNLPVSFSGVTNIDAGYMSSGVSSGAPYQILNTNADDLSNAVYESIMLGDVMDVPAWVIDPRTATKIVSYMQNTGTPGADKFIRNGLNGFSGVNFGGLDLYVSNNLTHTVTLTIGTNPTANDYFSLVIGSKTITFTFVASPSAAGHIDIGANAAATQANVRAAINGTGTGDGSDYFELSTEDRNWLKRNSPLSGTTSTACPAFSSNAATITIYGSLAVADSFTAGGDGFGNVSRHTIATARGGMFLAMPSGAVEYKQVDASGKHGKENVISQAYNGTIWHNDLPKVKDVVVYS